MSLGLEVHKLNFQDDPNGVKCIRFPSGEQVRTQEPSYIDHVVGARSETHESWANRSLGVADHSVVGTCCLVKSNRQKRRKTRLNIDVDNTREFLNTNPHGDFENVDDCQE